MEYQNIYKNPSLEDLDLIEILTEKYKLEDEALNSLPEKEKNIIINSGTYRAKWATKMSFQNKEFFPYSTILWDILFLLINQKIPADQLTLTIQEKTNLPIDICNSLSEEILNNPTIQKEIIAIDLNDDEDISEYDDEDEYKKDLPNIEPNPQNNESHPKNDGGLGQELV